MEECTVANDDDNNEPLKCTSGFFSGEGMGRGSSMKKMES